MKTKPFYRVNCWWATASETGKVYQWHWQKFFANPHDRQQREDWCGPTGIESNISNARIREMQANDILVCYQARVGIVGLARLASEGYQHPVKHYYTFDIQPRPVVWFANPLECAEIRYLPNARQDIEFLKMPSGTIFRITQPGFETILNFLLAKNPEQHEKVERFLAAKMAKR